jgi:uncharacterized protein (TIGR03435 family)
MPRFLPPAVLIAWCVAASTAMPARTAAQVPLPEGPPVDPALRFEVASIKPFNEDAPARYRMQSDARLNVTGASVRLLLRNAFRVQDDLLIGLPDWANTERYSIVAQPPAGTRVTAIPTMLANLLVDRFNLVTHRETRERQTFDLVLANAEGRLGRALTPTSAECEAMVDAGTPAAAPPAGADRPPCGTMQMAPGLARGTGVPQARLVPMLSQLTDRPVNDRTGLTGLYDFTLTFNPNLNPDAAANADAPHLFTALQEQLGLRLASQRAPAQVVVIDRIEKPTPD